MLDRFNNEKLNTKGSNRLKLKSNYKEIQNSSESINLSRFQVE